MTRHMYPHGLCASCARTSCLCDKLSVHAGVALSRRYGPARKASLNRVYTKLLTLPRGDANKALIVQHARLQPQKTERIGDSMQRVKRAEWQSRVGGSHGVDGKWGKNPAANDYSSQTFTKTVTHSHPGSRATGARTSDSAAFAVGGVPAPEAIRLKSAVMQLNQSLQQLQHP